MNISTSLTLRKQLERLATDPAFFNAEKQKDDERRSRKEKERRDYLEWQATAPIEEQRSTPFSRAWMDQQFPPPPPKTFQQYTEDHGYKPGTSSYENIRTLWIKKKGFDPVDQTSLDDDTIFNLRTANQCLDDSSKLPTPKPLCGSLWREGELAVLFSDSNLGKSIFAVQIANAISSGSAIEGICETNTPQAVLYVDCELSDKQFENRYRNDNGDLFPFSDNLYRLTLDADKYDTVDWSNRFVADVEKILLRSGIKVLVIDNITYLGNELDKGKNAAPLMKQLNALKKKYGVAILALAHTPKRDLSRPITQNDLAGSKMIFNFVDSCFAIGTDANEESTRYIIQLKERSDAIQFHRENVLICRVEKPDNFLRFEVVGCGREAEFLRVVSGGREELIAQARELSKQGLSLRQIGSQLGCSYMTVSRYLKE